MLSSSDGQAARGTSPSRTTPFIDGFLEWMDSPEGQQSIEALDLVFDALENAGVDARQRKIVWDDGKRLSIEQSAERIHARHPDVPRDQIEIHVWVGSKAARRNPTPNASSRNSTGSSSRGSTTMSARQPWQVSANRAITCGGGQGPSRRARS